MQFEALGVLLFYSTGAKSQTVIATSKSFCTVVLSRDLFLYFFLFCFFFGGWEGGGGLLCDLVTVEVVPNTQNSRVSWAKYPKP